MNNSTTTEKIPQITQGINLGKLVWQESETYFPKLEKEVILDKDRFQKKFEYFVETVFGKGKAYEFFFDDFRADFLNFHYYTHNSELLRTAIVSKRFKEKREREEDIKKAYVEKSPYIGFAQIKKMLPIQFRFNDKKKSNKEDDYLIIPRELIEELKKIRRDEILGNLSEEGINKKFFQIWKDNKNKSWRKRMTKSFQKIPLYIAPNSWEILRLTYESSRITLKWLAESKISLPRTIILLPIIVSNKQVGGAALVSQRLFDREETETLLWILKDFLGYLKIYEEQIFQIEEEIAKELEKREIATIVTLDKNLIERYKGRILELDKLIPITRWDIESFLREMPSKWELSYAALKKNEMIGFIIASILRDKESKVAFLHRIAVENKFQREGIGSHVVRRLFKDCRKEKISRVELRVYKNNWQARKFYEKLGFWHVESEPEKKGRVLYRKEI